MTFLSNLNGSCTSKFRKLPVKNPNPKVVLSCPLTTYPIIVVSTYPIIGRAAVLYPVVPVGSHLGRGGGLGVVEGSGRRQGWGFRLAEEDGAEKYRVFRLSRPPPP